MSISPLLIEWYNKDHRPLPWRETSDPFRIWLSEIILQQTRVDQGMPYYQRFVETFPTISQLAQAPEDQIMKLWQGLGYYSRARNLHATAKIIDDKYKGIFPSDYLHIRKLPGIGEYTSAAISSFAFNQPYAVVDGNVSRVLARLFGVRELVDTPAGKKIINGIAAELLNQKDPARHNQAIMEFGAVICKPALPQCASCFLNSHCEAFKLSIVHELPAKKPKTKVRDRFFNYLLIRYKDSIYMKKRGSGDIWQNLFELPLIETKKQLTAKQVTKSADWEKIMGKQPVQINAVIERKVHKLSHQNIFTRVFDVRMDQKPGTRLATDFIQISSQDAVNYAVPKVIENILEEQLVGYIHS